MNIELYILKALLKKENFLKFSSFVSKAKLKIDYGDIYRLHETVEDYFKDHDSDLTLDDLGLWFKRCYPGESKTGLALIEKVIDQMRNIEAKDELVETYFKESEERKRATDLGLAALKVAEGKGDAAEFRQLCFDFAKEKETQKIEVERFVTDDLDILLSETKNAQGLHWRHKILNQMLGPLRKGDFGFLFARPETGKTTILADSATHFATQTEKPILWFNNEEEGKKVMARCYQAHFGITFRQLSENANDFKERYKKEMAGKIRLYDGASISRSDVERVVSEVSPALIIFDQIDKIKGFADDRYDLELKALYQWARELAKEYCPVIGVCQAGGTGEGKRWLSMDDVDSSKTSKQGEADWILGIGKTNQEGFENVRHLHLCKNKLIGGPDTLPELRHGKRDILILPEIARYKDIDD